MGSGLPAKIFEEIRKDIINEVYPIGSKLPPERELATRYSASRFAVREAIAMLGQSGFVKTHPQSGSYILDFYKDGSLETLVQTLRIRRAIDRQTLDSLFKYRYTTETSAAADAAIRISDKDIFYLNETLKQKSINLQNINTLADLDYDFHFRVITVSENIINKLIFQSFKPIYYFFTEFFYSLSGAAKNSLELNYSLLETFKKRNPELASGAMGDILKYGEKRVYKAIDEREQLIVIQTGTNNIVSDQG